MLIEVFPGGIAALSLDTEVRTTNVRKHFNEHLEGMGVHAISHEKERDRIDHSGFAKPGEHLLGRGLLELLPDAAGDPELCSRHPTTSTHVKVQFGHLPSQRLNNLGTDRGEQERHPFVTVEDGLHGGRKHVRETDMRHTHTHTHTHTCVLVTYPSSEGP